MYQPLRPSLGWVGRNLDLLLPFQSILWKRVYPQPLVSVANGLPSHAGLHVSTGMEHTVNGGISRAGKARDKVVFGKEGKRLRER